MFVFSVVFGSERVRNAAERVFDAKLQIVADFVLFVFCSVPSLLCSVLCSGVLRSVFGSETEV